MNVQERIKEMNRNGKGVSEIARELMVFPKTVIEVLQGKDVFADKALIHTWDIDEYMETVNVGDDVVVYASHIDTMSRGLCPHEEKALATVKHKYRNVVETTEGYFQNKEIFQWNHNRGKFARELHSDWV